MYNLTSKKYIFFAISLLVLIPGFISLLFNHLNLGIDFTGGTTVDLAFRTTLSSQDVNTVTNVFATNAKAKDIKVYLSHEVGSQNSQTFWVQLNTPVDQTVQKAITARLTGAQNSSILFGAIQALPALNGVSPDGGKTTLTLLPYLFTPPASTTGGPAFKVKAADIQSVLTATPLPGTGPIATNGAPASAAPATATPAAAATPTTGTSTAPTTAVTVEKIIERTTDQIVTVQTQTQLSPAQLQSAEGALLAKYGALYQSQVQSVGAAIAGSTTFWAIVAVVFASVAILLYITFAFRNVGSSRLAFRFGMCAIIALIHDAFVVLGIWSILGWLFPNDFKVDTLFVTAILTVIGFSVHDTIVVFDRIRENLQRKTTEQFTDIVNASLLQTMARSLNTSLTVLITLSALVLFGGTSIRSFTLALLIGIFSGTYSSIFNASMLLVVWETGEWRKLFGGKVETLPATSRGAGARRVARAGV